MHQNGTINTKEIIMGTDNIYYFFAIFKKLVSHLWLKTSLSIALLPTFFFDPKLNEGMKALAILIAIDFVTGVITAKKTGQEIKSAKIFRTALKFAVYFTLIASGRLTIVAGLPFVPADTIILTFIATTELVSILENAGRSGYAIPQKLLNQLNEFRNKK